MPLLTIQIFSKKIMAQHFKMSKCIIEIAPLVKPSLFGPICVFPRWALIGQNCKALCGLSRFLNSGQ